MSQLVLIDDDKLSDLLTEVRELRRSFDALKKTLREPLEARPLSANEVAKRIRVRHAKVYAAIKSGELPCTDVPGRGGKPTHLVKPADADRWGDHVRSLNR